MKKVKKKLYFIDKSKDKENKSLLKFVIEEEKPTKIRFELIQKKRKRGSPKSVNINELKIYNKFIVKLIQITY